MIDARADAQRTRPSRRVRARVSTAALVPLALMLRLTLATVAPGVAAEQARSPAAPPSERAAPPARGEEPRSPRAAASPLPNGDAAAPAAAASATAAPAAAAAAPVPSAPRAAGSRAPSGRAMDRVELEASQITGNRELPRVLYIVPWRPPEPGDLSGKPVNSLLYELTRPVDREVFRRELRYFDAVAQGPQPDAGALAPAPAPVRDNSQPEPQPAKP